MKRTERIRGQREALLAAICGDEPPARGTPDELRAWARQRTHRGYREGEAAIGLGWTAEEVRRAVGERSGA